jgi:hypothetical protein
MSIGDRLSGAGGGVLFILYFALGIIQIVAFMEGLDVWFGFGALLSIITFVIVMFIGPLGSLAVAGIGFYGAWRGWQWEWWQAALLCFPFAVLGLVMMFGAGTMSLVGMIARKS